MKFFSSAALALILIGVGAAAGAETRYVRVRVKKELKSVDVSGLGVTVAPPTTLAPVATVPTGIGAAKITRSAKGQWLVTWRDIKTTERFTAEKLAIRGQLLRIGAEPVPYDLEVVKNPERGLDLVARLDLESYLAGVVPSEMPIAWPIEALKAQAVAARSYVLSMANERRSRDFDVDSTIIDQVYTFLHTAQTDPNFRAKIVRALAETRGQVLTNSRGQILKAFYSADCGCQSEDPKFVWGHVDAFVSVKDPTCAKRKPLSWDLNVDRVHVRSRLIAALDLPTDTELRALHVAGRTPSGRVAEVVAAMSVDGKSQAYNMSAQEFRKIFGFQKIRSADFSLQWLGDELYIRGTGAGHGVGLCQTGARALAEEGIGFKDILKFYYPKAKLKNLRSVAS